MYRNNTYGGLEYGVEFYELTGKYATPVAFKYRLTANIFDADDNRKKMGLQQGLQLKAARIDEKYLQERKNGAPVEFICLFYVLEVHTGSDDFQDFWARGRMTIKKRWKKNSDAGEVFIRFQDNKVRFRVPPNQ